MIFETNFLQNTREELLPFLETSTLETSFKKRYRCILKEIRNLNFVFVKKIFSN